VPLRPVKVTVLGFTPEQLALDKIPARLEDQVCALTGVNPMVAQLTSGAQHKTYNNVQEARKGFYEDTLIPMQLAFATCLEQQLLNDPGMVTGSGKVFVRFSYVNIPCMQDSQADAWERAGKAYQQSQIIKRSEAREALGLEWGPEDEVYYDETKPQVMLPGQEGGPNGPAIPGGDEDGGADAPGDEGGGDDEDADAGSASGKGSAGGRDGGGRGAARDPGADGPGGGPGPNPWANVRAAVVVLNPAPPKVPDPFGSASPGRKGGRPGEATDRSTAPLERVRIRMPSRKGRR
jgi:hypothetical protein